MRQIYIAQIPEKVKLNVTGLLNSGCNRKVSLTPFGNEGYTLSSETQTKFNIHRFGYECKKVTWKM